jgi:hypothetical protein
VTRSPRPEKWQYPKTAATPGRQCVDCIAEGYTATKRPAPYGGPKSARCATHERERKRAARMARSVKHVESTYDLTDEEYQALYRFQGGCCAICRRATGATKRLAVDHNHRLPCTSEHGQTKGCKKCVRGLLCSLCNDTIAHFRDDPAVARRAAAYLVQSPMHWLTRRLSASWPPFASDV